MQTALFAAMTVFLVLVISSRQAEDTGYFDSNSGYTIDAGSSTDVLDPDFVESLGVTATPEPTPIATVYKPDIDITSWEYQLANSDNYIGSYTPTVSVIEDSVNYFDSRAVDALVEFLDAARGAGFTPYVVTAYRSYSTQEYIFNGMASQLSWDGTYTYDEAVELAKAIVAYPGTSDHQTGLGVDIASSASLTLDLNNLDEDFYEWMDENCATYGFIARYPISKIRITGIDEPWHYRYVGVEAATYIMENGLNLEEFVSLYK